MLTLDGLREEPEAVAGGYRASTGRPISTSSSIDEKVELHIEAGVPAVKEILRVSSIPNDGFMTIAGGTTGALGSDMWVVATVAGIETDPRW